MRKTVSNLRISGQGGAVSFQSLEENDIKPIIEVLLDERTTIHLNDRMKTQQGLIQMINEMILGTQLERMIVLTIKPKVTNTDEFLGFIRIDLFPSIKNVKLFKPDQVLCPEHRSRACKLDLICVRPDFWRMKIMTEAASVLFQYLKGIDIDFVVTSIKPTNTAALSLAAQWYFNEDKNYDLSVYDLPFVITNDGGELLFVKEL